VGIRNALPDTDYILLLNNDTVVDPHFLSALIEICEGDSTVGIAGPLTMCHDNPDRIQHLGGRINLLSGHKSFLTRRPSIKSDMVDVDFVPGSGLLVRCDVLSQIGLLEPSYFFGFEDIEWCIRAKKSGWRVVMVPAAIIYHKESASVGGPLSAVAIYYHSRNFFLFMNRNGYLGWQLVAPVIFTGSRFKQMLKLLYFGKHRLVLYMWLGLRDYLRGSFGNGMSR
jgi:GT2 family glycosyltransferase